MSDQTPDPHDELLRAALEAEADDVVAGPELLDRIRTEAAKPDRRRLAPWLLAAAAVVALIGVGAVLLRDEDQPVDISEDPTSTSITVEARDGLPDLLSVLFACDNSITTVVYVDPGASDDDAAAIVERLGADDREPAVSVDEEAVRARLLDRYADDPSALRVIESNEIPSAILYSIDDPEEDIDVRSAVADMAGVYFITSTDCRDDPEPTEGTDPPPFGQPPTLVALVREDGWLVTIDLASGQENELHFVGDPNESSGVEEGGPSYIDAVDLSPDGRWVYFSTCCEPAVGTTYRIPIAGGEPEQVAMGAHPRVSPDGRYVATGGSEAVIITPTPGVGGDPVTVEVGCCARSLAWSPDGTQLAVVTGTGADGDVPQVQLFGWDGTALTPRDTGKPDNPGSFVSWTADGTLTVSSGGPIEDDRSLSQDRSYEWLLWVDEVGVVRQQAGHESGDRTPVNGLPETLTADW
jgi:hypothetical protein